MSDEADEYDDEITGSAISADPDDNENYDGDDDCQWLPPPCAICVGFLLLLASAYGIWHSEGDYVKRLKALNQASDVAKEPCRWSHSGDCGSCPQMSELKDGDLVFLACQLSNLKKLTDVGTYFDVPELLPLMESTRKAAKFSWDFSMWQFAENPRTTIQLKFGDQIGALDCPAARGLDDDNDHGAVKRIAQCCKKRNSFGGRHFESKYVGNTKQCQMRWRASSPVQITTTTSTTTLTKITINTLAVAQQRRLGDNRRKKTEDRRRRTAFSCNFPCYSWEEGYYTDRKEDPKEWKNTPQDKYQTVGYLQGKVAANLESFPLSNSHSNVDEVKVAGFKLQSFSPNLAQDDLWAEMSQVTLKSAGKTGEQQLPLETIDTPVELHPSGPSLMYTTYKRSDSWTPATSDVSQNCIASHTGDRGGLPGDLKVCFQASTLTSISILAEARNTADGWELVASRKHLRSKTRISSGPQGYLLKKNSIESLEELIEEGVDNAETSLFMGRVFFPLLLWLALFCCLTPIVWVIDTCGDAMECIPGIGPCLGGCADFIESLATMVICMVSLCGACACSLTIMAIAWLFYRPEIGVACLAAAIAFIALLICFAKSQKGTKKKRSARQPQLQNVEMSQGMAQRPGEAVMAQPAMAQPVMAQPMMQQPMMAQPAMAQPVMAQPMMQQPMMAQPMMQQPMMAQPMMQQPMMAQPMMQQPMMAESTMAQATLPQPCGQPAVQPTQPQLMQVVCPAGAIGGSSIMVSTADGRQVAVTVPANVMPGQPFMVQV